MTANAHETTDQPTEFEELGRMEQTSQVDDFLYFFKQSRKWWLLPVVALLAVLGAIAMFSGSAAAPFIYTLF